MAKLINYGSRITLIAMSIGFVSLLPSCGGPLVPFDSEWFIAPREGLIGEWLFEEGLKDTSPTDASIILNVGTRTQGRFNHNNAYTSVGASHINSPKFIFNYTDTITISSWVKVDNLYFDNSAFVNFTALGAGSGFEFAQSISIADQKIIWDSGRNAYGSSHFVMGLVPPKNAWIHLVSTYNNQLMKLYVNGNLQGQGVNTFNAGTQIPTNTTTGDLFLGYFAVPASVPVPGYLDDIRVYNRTLTDEEIQRLYHEHGYAYYQ